MSAQVNQNFVVLFGSEDEEYSDEGVDISDHPFWDELKEVMKSGWSVAVFSRNS